MLGQQQAGRVRRVEAGACILTARPIFPGTPSDIPPVATITGLLIRRNPREAPEKKHFAGAGCNLAKATFPPYTAHSS